MRNWSKISLKKLDVLNSILFLEISLYFELTIVDGLHLKDVKQKVKN